LFKTQGQQIESLEVAYRIETMLGSALHHHNTALVVGDHVDWEGQVIGDATPDDH
jgi:hypothetical protein